MYSILILYWLSRKCINKGNNDIFRCVYSLSQVKKRTEKKTGKLSLIKENIASY